MTQDDKADPVMRAFPQSKALLLSELEKVLEATKYQPPTSHEGQLHITAVQLRALLLAEPYKYKPDQPRMGAGQVATQNKSPYRWVRDFRVKINP